MDSATSRLLKIKQKDRLQTALEKFQSDFAKTVFHDLRERGSEREGKGVPTTEGEREGEKERGVGKEEERKGLRERGRGNLLPRGEGRDGQKEG